MEALIKHKGIYLPDGEEHLTDMIDRGPMIRGRGTYQYKKYLKVLEYCPEPRGTVIDIGAHVGLWSMHFVHDFQYTVAFEPVMEHFNCFLHNMDNQGVVATRYALYKMACGNEKGHVYIQTDPASSGDSYPTPDGSETKSRAQVAVVDDFHIENVSLIKVDCEGYELYALKGAEATILENKPTIIVEQKPGRAQKFGLGERDAIPYLENLGMKLQVELSGDFILTWQ